MENLVSSYQRLLQLLEEENNEIVLCMEGELLEKYRRVLQKEKEEIEKNIRFLCNY